MNKLLTIKFKNRLYLLFIFIPFAFILFILTGIILFIVLKIESMVLFAVIFLTGLNFLTSLFARFRYIPAGIFNFNREYIEYNGKKKRWVEMKSIDIYYRGDSFWHSRFKVFQKYKAYRRYKNLNYLGINKYDEKMLDKIDFDGDLIYFKIRNKQDKDIFFKIKELAESHDLKTTVKNTDFSYSLFGKTYGKQL